MSKEKTKQVNPVSEKVSFSFNKENYKMMSIGVGIVLLGMLLMIGGKSDNPNKMTDEIFDFQRITLAPIIIIAGYVVVLLSILKKPKE